MERRSKFAANGYNEHKYEARHCDRMVFKPQSGSVALDGTVRNGHERESTASDAPYGPVGNAPVWPCAPSTGMLCFQSL